MRMRRSGRFLRTAESPSSLKDRRRMRKLREKVVVDVTRRNHRRTRVTTVGGVGGEGEAGRAPGRSEVARGVAGGRENDGREVPTGKTASWEPARIRAAIRNPRWCRRSSRGSGRRRREMNTKVNLAGDS